MFWWQLSHEREVMKWPEGLADAPKPLWQARQVLGVMPLWLNCAGNQVVGRWQMSQEVVTIRWRAGMPEALLPSWQSLHLPAATPLWSKLLPRLPRVGLPFKVLGLMRPMSGLTSAPRMTGLTCALKPPLKVWQLLPAQSTPVWWPLGRCLIVAMP